MIWIYFRALLNFSCHFLAPLAALVAVLLDAPPGSLGAWLAAQAMFVLVGREYSPYKPRKERYKKAKLIEIPEWLRAVLIPSISRASCFSSGQEIPQ